MIAALRFVGEGLEGIAFAPSLTPRTAARLLLTAKRNVMLRALGDVPGHEFHGNQYVEKGAGDSERNHGEVVAKSKYGQVEIVKSGAGPVRYLGRRKNGENVGTYNKIDSEKDALRAPVETGHWPSGYRRPDVGWKHLAAAVNRDNTPLHRAADASYRQMLLVVSAAFMRGKKAYKSGGVDAAVKAIRASLLATLPPALLKAYGAGGEVGVASLKKLRATSVFERMTGHKASCASLHNGQGIGTFACDCSFRAAKDTPSGKLTMRFDASNPRAAKWAKQHAAELADGISETSRERIRNAVERAHEEGDLRESYEEILDAVGSEARADVISRTETMWAAAEGQQAAWEDAVESGLLSEGARVAWISTSGCCDACDEMDGEERTIDGEYEGEYADGPPGHPNCRCSEGIVG